MHLVVTGLNHETAPVELREKLSITDARLSDALADLKTLDTVTECLILSTCNRTEVYTYTSAETDDAAVIRWMADFCELPQEDFASHLYTHPGRKAVEHLFGVAAGIKSMVVGEYQILGQVKGAYSIASNKGFTGPALNPLFQQAIKVGKRVRTETEIGRGAFSIGSAAVQLVRSIFDDLSGRTVLVLGAGKMGELAITHLASSGVSTVLVANRTYEKAVELASRFNGRPISFEELQSALESADIVIASTGAEEPVINCEMVSSAMRVRRGRPIFFIDIAVPRDIEANVADIGNAFVYDIDDLKAVVKADAAGRQAEIAKVETIIAEEVAGFMKRICRRLEMRNT